MSQKAKSIASKKESGKDERLQKVSKLRLLLNRPELGALGGAILVFIFFGIVAGDTGMFSAYGTLNFLDVSANLGITAARDILNKNFDVVSVIGDGAISAGMAFEGLNNIGHLHKNSLIILNDNEMSIAQPVGAMSKYLVNLLSSKTYENIRDIVKNFTKQLI